MDEINARRFFEHHLGQSLPHRDQVTLRCPFHDDGTASLSVNLQDGVWKCHAGCGEGGLIDFEMMKSNCDREAANSNVSRIVGTELFHSGDQPEAIYQYRDAEGRLLFEKLRMPGKVFRQRRKTAKGYAYNLNGVQKPLYNLPEVVTASAVVICEGEKDCDNVALAFEGLADDVKKQERIATTTNFDGAKKWSDSYNPYFAGKRVVIIPDNDAIGAEHAQLVAHSVHPYAAGVKVVNLPGLPDNGDVSDYLANHPVTDLLNEVAETTAWFPSTAVSTWRSH